MKLFVAIVPPRSALQELAAAVRPLHALPQAAALRWTALPTWHLTLAFLGQVDDGTLPELERGLAAVAAGQPEFELRLGGGGRFGDRALWAGVGGDTAALARLAGATTEAVGRVGIGTDDHPFTGHLTLARSSVPRDSRDRGPRRPGAADLGPLADALAGFRGEPWPTGALRLMDSQSIGAGRHYETTAAWTLPPRG
ncbi:RNA 2',3'-cyclic phosphodiesterase [Streptacidiphilus sp. P02-A3a]|uniref:RNA 2',3'-cyclic phosphodiesterase n=1 Tax=Streptacidiphilus sp. P02-A3a TaxID=2704468 RepID=UPI0015F857B1|nr:RNA 2',3'-cyclic phosphodiesterase [Streptacidiphilus sp. P02-A3a]QMU72911.1 RNA 2',3'-cyclic phosphodiesterase [Streptacidiphilus sp. P02-A3a]